LAQTVVHVTDQQYQVTEFVVCH